MSKTNKTTKVATFYGWGTYVPQGDGIWEGDNTPTAGMDFAHTSCGKVGWTNRFTGVCPGEKVVVRVTPVASGKEGKWVMTGHA